MRRATCLLVAFLMAVTVFAMPEGSYAATKAPGKVSTKSLKVTVVKGNSLKFAWGKAKTKKKVLKKTSDQIKYTVRIKQENGTWKTTVKNKVLKKGRKFSHIYKGTKGNTYKITLNARGYNGKKFGKWTKAKTFTRTIPAFTPKYGALNPTLNQIGEDRSITMPGYLNTQGLVFDKYTGKDGYNFAGASKSGCSGVQVVHFELNGDTIDNVGVVHYDSPGDKQQATTYGIGHANDGAMYKDNARKYMFVSISGGVEESFKDSDGRSGQKMGYIDMAEHSEAEATGGEGRVHGVTIKVNNGVTMSSTLARCKFSGVTYTGMRTVSGASRPVFVLKDGRTFYAAYATFDAGGRPTLTIFDSARIVKPYFNVGGKNIDAATQDITYHGGFIYINYCCKIKGYMTWFKIARITYADLFRDTYGDLRIVQECTRNTTTAESTKDGKIDLVKHITESIFFTSMDGKGNLHMSVNRGTNAGSGSDHDAVLRSKEVY